MDPRVLSALSQWFMYFLPTIVAWVQRRKGKPIILPFGLFVFANIFLAWTVVVWILLMANALGYNPVPWVIFKLAKFFPSINPGQPQNPPPKPAPPSTDSMFSQAQVCSHCGGTGTVKCTHCDGRGSWYTQPTTATEVAQLQSCTYCQASGRVRCPHCGGHNL